MHFLLFSDIGDNAVEGLRGAEHDRGHLLDDFRSVLSRLGTVNVVRSPLAEVDTIFDIYRARGEACVFVCLAAPHRALLGLRCPTILVFAWGCSTIPDESWGGDARNDWRSMLETVSGAIVLSGYGAAAVRSAMLGKIPVGTLAPPLWDRLARARGRLRPSARIDGGALCIRGIVVDTLTRNFSADLLVQPVRPLEHPESPPAIQPVQPSQKTTGSLAAWFRSLTNKVAVQAPQTGGAWPAAPTMPSETRLSLKGVVYTAVFNPTDSAMNWFDIVSAFCWAFRDAPDATLILKMVHDDYDEYRDFLNLTLSRLEPFDCRVIAIHASFDAAAYEQLVATTSYFVDASESAALCLPLMEFMTFGRPAIAPQHTAMKEYIDADSSFIIRSSRQLGTRPHDWKMMLRADRYRLDWESLLLAYRESYRIAKTEPERYDAMSRAARDRIQNVASDDIVAAQFHAFLSRSDIGRKSVVETNGEQTTHDIVYAGAASRAVSEREPESTTAREIDP